MAKATAATVIAPDTNRAPRNQFPGPFDDYLAGKNSKCSQFLRTEVGFCPI